MYAAKYLFPVFEGKEKEPCWVEMLLQGAVPCLRYPELASGLLCKHV